MSDDRAVKALERRMNRPLALALASLVVTNGVFFAGFTLIVNSPKVTFPPELVVMTPTAGHTRVVQVGVDLGTSGTTATAALKVVSRGGEATIPAFTPSGHAGQAGSHRTSSKPEAVKRLTSIGAESAPNGDNGLA